MLLLHLFVALVTLTAPVPYQTFQRKPTNVGSIYVAGTTTFGGNIEARFNGGAWSRIARNVAPGPFVGELAAQAPGQGLLEVREIGQPAVAVESVGLGDVYAIAGQSNACGWGDTLHVAEHPSLTATLFGNDGQWKPLADRSDDPTGQLDAVSLDPGCGGSVWPLVATRLMAATGVPVAFIPCAKASTSVLQWQPGANHYDRSALYGSMAYRVSQLRGSVKAVIFWQGERDCVLGTGQSDYYQRMVSLAAAVAQDLRCKVVLPLLQTEPGRLVAQQATIRAAQRQAWGFDQILPGPDLSGITAENGFHLVTDSTQRPGADLFAAALLAL